MVRETPSSEDLYQTILDRSSLPLPGFEEAVDKIARHRAQRIHEHLLDRADRLCNPCRTCWKRYARKSQVYEIYENPHGGRVKVVSFCTQDHADSYLRKAPYWKHTDIDQIDDPEW